MRSWRARGKRLNMQRGSWKKIYQAGDLDGNGMLHHSEVQVLLNNPLVRRKIHELMADFGNAALDSEIAGVFGMLDTDDEGLTMEDWTAGILRACFFRAVDSTAQFFQTRRVE